MQHMRRDESNGSVALWNLVRSHMDDALLITAGTLDALITRIWDLSNDTVHADAQIGFGWDGALWLTHIHAHICHAKR